MCRIHGHLAPVTDEKKSTTKISSDGRVDHVTAPAPEVQGLAGSRPRYSVAVSAVPLQRVPAARHHRQSSSASFGQGEEPH